MKLQFSLGLVAAVLLPWFAGCSRGAHADPDFPLTPPPTVRVMPLAEQTVTDFNYFTGRMDAVDSVDVRARVTGYLDQIAFKHGQLVKKGELLFLIDQRPYKAMLDQAAAQVAVDDAAYRLAIANNNRAKRLAETNPGAITKQELDQRAAEELQGAAAVKKAQANVVSAQLNLDFTHVISPIDGMVGRPLVTVGNLVVQDNTLLTTIVSQDPMYGYFDVDEAFMLRVQAKIRAGEFKSPRQGDLIEVDYGLTNEPNRYPHKGFIDFVNNRVDPNTGTLQVRGRFDNPDPGDGGPRLLTPGLFVHVRVPLGPPHKALVVPQAAIGMDLGQKYVLRVNKEHKVEQCPVLAGPLEENGMQVISPVMLVRNEAGVRHAADGEQGEPSVQVGDEIIISGLQKAIPGSTVNPEPPATTSTPAATKSS